jgi:hypothetical protein
MKPVANLLVAGCASMQVAPNLHHVVSRYATSRKFALPFQRDGEALISKIIQRNYFATLQLIRLVLSVFFILYYKVIP